MSFFKEELTELELMEKEINLKTRMTITDNYILDEEEFVEVKVGNQDADNISNTEQLPSERNNYIPNR